MIPASPDGSASGGGGARSVWHRFRALMRQYLWLWIAYQTVKGSLTLCLIWLPIWWAYQG